LFTDLKYSNEVDSALLNQPNSIPKLVTSLNSHVISGFPREPKIAPVFTVLPSNIASAKLMFCEKTSIAGLFIGTDIFRRMSNSMTQKQKIGCLRRQKYYLDLQKGHPMHWTKDKSLDLQKGNQMQKLQDSSFFVE